MLYSKGQFGLTNPESLQRTLWWHMTLLFGHRGRDESRQLKWGDVQLKSDSTGQEYLEFNERGTKTRDGGGELRPAVVLLTRRPSPILTILKDAQWRHISSLLLADRTV